MLNTLEQQQIDEELRHNAVPRGAVPEALKIVQRHRGWVSNEAVADVAAYLGLTRDEVDSVATGYSNIFRQPVGRHVIRLCRSVSCWLTGLNPLYARLRDELGIDYGQTTADGRFTLLPAVCLGACDRGPALMIDDDLYGPLTPETVMVVLEPYA